MMSVALRMRRASLAGFCLVPVVGFAAADTLNEVVVSATRLREQAQIDVPASVTVLDAQTLTDSAQQHFEEVLAQVPNLNWAAGTSRPRYFQIRGIGEREQYEGAPNSSVGFLIDDIDFSGVGMAATLFDVSQIEVLHGPQGTRLGANALAGLIAVHTMDPEEHYNASLLADAGNYETRSLGAAATGPVESLDSAWRLSVQEYRSDGFRTNAFLNRDDTNNRDELTARGKWRWHASENSQLDLTFLHSNLANGYDAFSIDNSRITLSDEPGVDSQLANAAAVKWNNTFANGSALTLIATALNSSSVNSFDADWGNPQSWAPYDYSYVYRADRTHDTRSIEARLASAPVGPSGSDRSFAWLVGAYALRLQESLEETTNYSEPLLSDYQATNVALFAQIDGRFAQRWLWEVGLRGEQRAAAYSDTRPSDTDRNDRMMGGHASLSYEATDTTRLYGSISRGYKAGGFNLGSSGSTHQEFEPEYLWNFELGVKSSALQDRLYFETTLFYMQRDNMQERSGEQADPNNPGTYVFVTSNVTSGYNYGLESSIRWLPTDSLELGAALGLLRTSESGAVGEDGLPIAPRAQAHAPEYQAQINATFRQSGWMARVDVSALDSFYFDVPSDHDQRSQAYELVNFKVGYEAEHWSLHAWMRNVFDQTYATRGFYFVNDPAATEPQLYIQNGDPQQFGVSAQWSVR
jgi:outer membrane receptor protein involved in Fe transport